jgi:hypothetical protein
MEADIVKREGFPCEKKGLNNLCSAPSAPFLQCGSFRRIVMDFR